MAKEEWLYREGFRMMSGMGQPPVGVSEDEQFQALDLLTRSTLQFRKDQIHRRKGNVILRSKNPQRVDYINDRRLSGGYSGANVQSQNSPFVEDRIEDSGSIDYQFRRTDIGDIEKTQDKFLTGTEYTVLTGLKSRGSSVPRVRKKTETCLEVKRVDGLPLDERISSIYLARGRREIPLDEASQRITRIVNSAISESVKADCYLGEILTPKQKRELHRRNVRRFGRSSSEVSHLMAEPFGEFFDQEFFDISREFQKEYQKGLKKYGQWVIDPYPRNLIVDEAGNVTLIDGNHPEYGLMQVSDTLLFDAYSPLVKADGTNLATTHFLRRDPQTGIYEADEQQKVELVRSKVTKWNEVSDRKITDFEDYLKNYYLARAFKSTRLMGREIRELERALVGQSNKGTYQFIYDQNQRILHHWQSASLALQILDSQFGIKTGKMHDYIYTHATEYMNSFLNPRLLEDSVGFLERQGHGADFIRDKYNLCPLDSSLITDCEEVAA